MAEIAILGKHGFIGSALAKRFEAKGIEVASFPTPDTKVLFHFGSPVHIPFEQNPDYHLREIIDSFLNLLPYCRDNGIHFVYASSALVYEKNTAFANSKRALELLALCYPQTLGLRIFPVYGPGENRTVISQWCKSMQEGKQPVLWGDGEQKRDFIYIEDAIDQILSLVASKAVGISDIGAGNPVSFNDIISTINTILGSDIKPEHTPRPEGYSEGIVCQKPLPIKFKLYDGINRILER